MRVRTRDYNTDEIEEYNGMIEEYLQSSGISDRVSYTNNTFYIKDNNGIKRRANERCLKMIIRGLILEHKMIDDMLREMIEDKMREDRES